MRNRLPDLLGDVWHERVEKSEDLIEHVEQHLTGVLSVLAVALQARLCKLDVPVAVAVPDELVNLLNRDTQLELAKVLIDLLSH